MAQEAQARVEDPRAGRPRDPPPMLAGFIRYLEGSGLVDFYVEGRGSWLDYDEAAACNGIKIQALVLLANRFGLGSPYECDGFIFGPNSEPLAEDVRTLSRGRAAMYDGVPASAPGAFRREEFEALVRGRDMDWLIAASSFAQMRDNRPTRDGLIDFLDGHHAAYTRKYLSGVIDSLVDSGIIPGYA